MKRRFYGGMDLAVTDESYEGNIRIQDNRTMAELRISMPNTPENIAKAREALGRLVMSGSTVDADLSESKPKP